MLVDYRTTVATHTRNQHVGFRVLPTHVESKDEGGKTQVRQVPGSEVILRPGFQRVDPSKWEVCKSSASAKHLVGSGALKVFAKGMKLLSLMPHERLDAVSRTTDPEVLAAWKRELDGSPPSADLAHLRDELNKSYSVATTDLQGNPAQQRSLQMAL